MTKDQAMDIIENEIKFHREMAKGYEGIDASKIPQHLADPRVRAENHRKAYEAFEMALKALRQRNVLNELINTIREEINQSSTSKYICKDGAVIYTDVGYVEDWFNSYADVLRKKYNIV